MQNEVAFRTPFRDRRSGVHLEVQIDVPVLLAHLFDHAPQRLFVERLASTAYIVDSRLAVMLVLAGAIAVNTEPVTYLKTLFTSIGAVCTRTNRRT